MSDAADNMDRRRQEAREARSAELQRRVTILYVQTPSPRGERACSICGGHFADQGRYNLAEHFKTAHAEAILAMPAEGFK